MSQVEPELLLLNIARAWYHRPVYFTAMSSVASTIVIGMVRHNVEPRLLEDQIRVCPIQGWRGLDRPPV